MREDILLHLKSHPLYEDFQANLLSYRPNPPTYNPRDDNTEIWRFESAKQEGFDLLLKLFKIEV